MRRPSTIEHLYLDFDGFFASCEQLRDPALRGRPVGVVPYVGGRHGILIACSREAKAAGIKNIMPVEDAKRLCRDLVLVPQKPQLYRRAHNALLAEIASILPIDVVKSIDELSCRLDENGIADPQGLGYRIKRAIRYEIGASITCSIGFAANRHLAKIAGGTQKPDGLTVWTPEIMPAPLVKLPIEDIPGIGERMARRLAAVGIIDTQRLLDAQPKHLRALWKSVTGERLWYALHGWDVQAPLTERGMFGHSRVLPPEARDRASAKAIARLLLTKAARRLRREGYYASSLTLWVQFGERFWSERLSLPQVRDDKAVLDALGQMWDCMDQETARERRVMRVGVTLGDLTRATARQFDFLTDDDQDRLRWESIGDAIDDLNERYGRTVASVGPWAPPEGGNVGGKISFTRIPSAEDFW